MKHGVYSRPIIFVKSPRSRNSRNKGHANNTGFTVASSQSSASNKNIHKWTWRVEWQVRLGGAGRRLEAVFWQLHHV